MRIDDLLRGNYGKRIVGVFIIVNKLLVFIEVVWGVRIIGFYFWSKVGKLVIRFL